MFALARKTVFGLLATSLVIGTAQMASAKPWPKPQPWPHFYHGPAVIINPVTVVAPVTPVPAAIQLINPATNQVALPYAVNGGPVQSLPAGYSVTLHQESVVTFDRGGSAGWGRCGLTSGVYKFIPANGAWTIVSDATPSPVVATATPVPAN